MEPAPENRYRCKIQYCSKVFLDRHYLEKHLDNKHSDLRENEASAIVKEQYFQNYVDDSWHPTSSRSVQHQAEPPRKHHHPHAHSSFEYAPRSFKTRSQRAPRASFHTRSSHVQCSAQEFL